GRCRYRSPPVLPPRSTSGCTAYGSRELVNHPIRALPWQVLNGNKAASGVEAPVLSQWTARLARWSDQCAGRPDDLDDRARGMHVLGVGLGGWPAARVAAIRE